MMYPKPKSAPGRLPQSKFVKNRTNAMKEIEAWVKKDDDPGSSHEASRMSGQLTDNVTEERMLRSKLWELSKERYKFLTQNAYEKKMFTDRMQRKSSALLRRASSAAGSMCDTESSRAGVSSAKQRWRNARMALLDRLNPEKQKGDAKSEDGDKVDGKESAKRKGSAAGSRGRVTPAATPISVTPAAGNGSGRVILAPIPISPAPSPGLREEGSQVTHKPPPSPMFVSNPRNVKFNQAANTQTSDSPSRLQGQGPSPAAGRGYGASRNRPPPGNLPSPGLFPSRPPSGSVASSKPNSAASMRSKPWGSTQATPITNPADMAAAGAFGGKRGVLANRFGMRLESKTADPRYAELENSLSPIQRQRSGPSDIKTIVKTFDALHVPSRRRPEAKPKTELKALEYIEEQGFLLLEKR